MGELMRIFHRHRLHAAKRPSAGAAPAARCVDDLRRMGDSGDIEEQVEEIASQRCIANFAFDKGRVLKPLWSR